MQGPSSPSDPLFVGGTGRSGTHAIARVIGQHPQYASIPLEVKFHADPPGLPGLFDGNVSLDKFLQRLQGHWWSRTLSDGTQRGLSRKVSEETFVNAVAAFQRDFEGDRDAAAAALLRALLDPMAEAKGKPSWVENTNRNVAVSPMLLRMFPQAKFIHIMRDGRDSASSLVHQHWGPDRIEDTLEWWEDRMTKTELGSAQIPADRLLVVNFEDFVVRDREGTIDRVLEFAGLPDNDRMRRYFDSHTNPDRANIGRWRKGVSERKQAKLTKRYAKALERLIALDTPGRSLFERALATVDEPVAVA